ncbi:response regulator, partial [Phascolarctobacterium succinatutens]|uniref:response regulator n=1 Tax=Phascolarctobacterium succinatutens TaxID=626940 RepID=UPI004026FAB9
TCDRADDGSVCVEKFCASKENAYDAILMDMQMPEMDGCEAAEAIRALPREDAHAVPILALTGNSGSDDVERAMAAGMNDFMVKPVQMKLLAQMMGAYLQH